MLGHSKGDHFLACLSAGRKIKRDGWKEIVTTRFPSLPAAIWRNVRPSGGERGREAGVGLIIMRCDLVIDMRLRYQSVVRAAAAA